MARFIAIDAVFFLLPFAAYALWLVFTRGSARNIDDWQVRTIAYLAIAGAGLLLGAVIAFISFAEVAPDQVYVPAHIENGAIVPGHFEPAPSG
jgi:uncharacterized protein DUF6111